MRENKKTWQSFEIRDLPGNDRDKKLQQTLLGTLLFLHEAFNSVAFSGSTLTSLFTSSLLSSPGFSCFSWDRSSVRPVLIKSSS